MTSGLELTGDMPRAAKLYDANRLRHWLTIDRGQTVAICIGGQGKTALAALCLRWLKVSCWCPRRTVTIQDIIWRSLQRPTVGKRSEQLAALFLTNRP
jgi:hypothetical protein